ncbi:hypothetical protein BTZ20_4600 [Rhodococcus sp. MTM3W5.2]|uniref:hypothetical protein n=1 Tax=Rhodococcus sp. MTM3W5.2 TaxID=1805827 RepID=UPI0009793420|nr:hypothetical protein [Rhodococcus sp. MTM3W5.2]AQA24582.1 hypothetical protein BTZ20_4600 [Rhodococcus sp. MTM3W5.2]
MRKSLNTGIVRKRAGIAAAGLAAAAAIAVPGVAWANDAIPQGAAVAVGESAPAVAGVPLDAETCAAMAIELSPETLQKMIENGTAAPAVATVPATPAGEPGLAVTKMLTEEEAQRMIADGMIVRDAAPAVLPRARCRRWTSRWTRAPRQVP